MLADRLDVGGMVRELFSPSILPNKTVRRHERTHLPSSARDFCTCDTFLSFYMGVSQNILVVFYFCSIYLPWFDLCPAQSKFGKWMPCIRVDDNWYGDIPVSFILWCGYWTWRRYQFLRLGD